MENSDSKPKICPICSGKMTESTTTFTAELGTGVVLVRDVPALICEQCGEEWIDAITSGKLEEIASNAKKQKHQIEVLAY